ncbi:MAG: hypothetical protein SV062_05665, partial [Thermodesulfobacteriota bacterium]|nr:hypothetical protein [Thermodesulfobacteriota bacterium]
MKRIFLMLIVLLIFKVCFVYAIEIKEGVVITGDNYKKYAGELKKLLPATTFEQFIDDIKGNVITVPVVKKRKRPEPEAFARYT